METPKKNKGGRPRKRPTWILNFRGDAAMKKFFKEQENGSKFITDLITNTKEYKTFVAKLAEQENNNQPSLFKDDK